MSSFYFGFAALVLLTNIIISGSFYPLIYFAIALIHEMGHILSFRLIGGKIKRIYFVGFGICIEKEGELSYKQDIFVAAGGPIINLMIGACLIHFTNGFFRYAGSAGIIYGIFNLLPLAPLDGEKIVSGFLYGHFDYLSAKRISMVIKWITLLLISFWIFIFLARGNINLSLLSIYIVLVFGSILNR